MSNKLVYGTKSIGIKDNYKPLLKELNYTFEWVVLSRVNCEYHTDEYTISPFNSEHDGEDGYVMGNKDGIPMGIIILDDHFEPPKFTFLATDVLQPRKVCYRNNYVRSTSLRKLVYALKTRMKDSKIPFYGHTNSFFNPIHEVKHGHSLMKALKKIEGHKTDTWTEQQQTKMDADIGAKIIACALHPNKFSLTQEEKNAYQDMLDRHTWATEFVNKQRNNVEYLASKPFWVIGKDNLTKLHYIGKTKFIDSDKLPALKTMEIDWKAYEEVEDYPESDRLTPTLINVNMLRDEMLSEYELRKCTAPYTCYDKFIYMEDLQTVSVTSAPSAISGHEWSAQWLIIFDV